MTEPFSAFAPHFQCLENKPEAPWAQLFFAHGAGAGWDYAWMEAMSALLEQQGIWVRRLEFPYAQWMRANSRRRPPQPVPELVAYYRAIIAAHRDSQLPCYIGGKSLGGRVAVMAAGDEVDGVLAFGYPFHPVKKPETLRLAPLLNTARPVLVVQGERDPFGTHAEVQGYDLPPLVTMQWLTDGDHDWKPRVASGCTQKRHWQKAAELSAAFMRTTKACKR
ncbi:MAG TPA: alpha/beta family hydrolase [Alcanivoracaceae bacterium]|nr:alpha/beta family hydrolase [Alcanivoracaceae bacterium]